MPLLALSVILGAAGVSAAPPAQARPSLAAARRWACFYGANLSSAAARSLDLLVADPDNLQGTPPPGPWRVAYISAGEADERRWFWPQTQGRDYLVEPNPDWAGAKRVDIRAQDWRSLLISSVVPAALAQGWQGVMLDTLDTAEYFESSAPTRFGGSMAAAASFILELRTAHPGMLILVNNALPILFRVAFAIDGVLAEDLYTRCLPNKPCTRSPAEEAGPREEFLRKFTTRTGKPVFAIIYAHPGERKSRLVRDSVRRARRAGFIPYVAGPSLERLGTADPEPR